MCRCVLSHFFHVVYSRDAPMHFVVCVPSPPAMHGGIIFLVCPAIHACMPRVRWTEYFINCFRAFTTLVNLGTQMNWLDFEITLTVIHMHLRFTLSDIQHRLNKSIWLIDWLKEKLSQWWLREICECFGFQTSEGTSTVVYIHWSIPTLRSKGQGHDETKYGQKGRGVCIDSSRSGSV